MQAPRKIVVIGPESTGKSTLSAALAVQMQTQWVPEYAREYLEHLDRPYEESDLLAIAAGQLANEEALFSSARSVLICDTDLYVLKVWSEARFGRCHRKILEAIATHHYDLYLLTHIDVPWAADPLREHPAERDRHYFYSQYRDIVVQSGVPWADVRGDETARINLALAAISANF